MINWLFSNQTSNFGTFLFGISSIIGFVSGIFYIKRLRKEKKSKIAEEALSSLDSFSLKFRDWSSLSATFFIYSRDSKANKALLEKAPETEKVFDKDPTVLI
jgi:hypothetical protein